jgi:hypothetical protein
VKNPATAEGFTVIFQKARDDKKTSGPGHLQAGIPPAFRVDHGSAGDGGHRSGDSHQDDTPPRRVKVHYSLHSIRGHDRLNWIESCVRGLT